MTNTIRKTLLACAAMAAMTFSASASADELFPDFTVNAGIGGKNVIFTADKITGNYTEVIDFLNNGTFKVSLFWDAAAFVANDGQNQYKASETGLSATYGLYALYNASGTYSTVGKATTFNFSPNSGELTVYLDKDGNTKYTSTNQSDLIGTGTNDDIVLATGKPLSGNGTLDTGLSTCGAGGGQGILCGGFGSTTTFELNDDGKKFFINPTPFYPLSFQSGQLNNFNPSGRQVLNGSLDVVFAVPEPTSVAILGLGLVGLGMSRRRTKKA